jgi:hypothetical protein
MTHLSHFFQTTVNNTQNLVLYTRVQVSPNLLVKISNHVHSANLFASLGGRAAAKGGKVKIGLLLERSECALFQLNANEPQARLRTWRQRDELGA